MFHSKKLSTQKNQKQEKESKLVLALLTWNIGSVNLNFINLPFHSPPSHSASCWMSWGKKRKCVYIHLWERYLKSHLSLEMDASIMFLMVQEMDASLVIFYYQCYVNIQHRGSASCWKPTAEAFAVASAHYMYRYLFTPIVFLSPILSGFTSDSCNYSVLSVTLELRNLLTHDFFLYFKPIFL